MWEPEVQTQQQTAVRTLQQQGTPSPAFLAQCSTSRPSSSYSTTHSSLSLLSVYSEMSLRTFLKITKGHHLKLNKTSPEWADKPLSMAGMREYWCCVTRLMGWLLHPSFELFSIYILLSYLWATFPNKVVVSCFWSVWVINRTGTWIAFPHRIKISFPESYLAPLSPPQTTVPGSVLQITIDISLCLFPTKLYSVRSYKDYLPVPSVNILVLGSPK